MFCHTCCGARTGAAGLEDSPRPGAVEGCPRKSEPQQETKHGGAVQLSTEVLAPRKIDDSDDLDTSKAYKPARSLTSTRHRALLSGLLLAVMLLASRSLTNGPPAGTQRPPLPMGEGKDIQAAPEPLPETPPAEEIPDEAVPRDSTQLAMQEQAAVEALPEIRPGDKTDGEAIPVDSTQQAAREEEAAPESLAEELAPDAADSPRNVNHQGDEEAPSSDQQDAPPSMGTAIVVEEEEEAPSQEQEDLPPPSVDEVPSQGQQDSPPDLGSDATAGKELRQRTEEAPRSPAWSRLAARPWPLLAAASCAMMVATLVVAKVVKRHSSQSARERPPRTGAPAAERASVNQASGKRPKKAKGKRKPAHD